MVIGANPEVSGGGWGHCLTEATMSGIGAKIGLSCAALLSAAVSWCIKATLERDASSGRGGNSR